MRNMFWRRQKISYRRVAEKYSLSISTIKKYVRKVRCGVRPQGRIGRPRVLYSISVKSIAETLEFGEAEDIDNIDEKIKLECVKTYKRRRSDIDESDIKKVSRDSVVRYASNFKILAGIPEFIDDKLPTVFPTYPFCFRR